MDGATSPRAKLPSSHEIDYWQGTAGKSAPRSRNMRATISSVGRTVNSSYRQDEFRRGPVSCEG